MKCVYIDKKRTISKYSKLRAKYDDINYLDDCIGITIQRNVINGLDFKNDKYKIIYKNMKMENEKSIKKTFVAFNTYPNDVKMGWNICYNSELIIYAERIMSTDITDKNYMKILHLPFYNGASPKATMISKHCMIYGPSIVCRKDGTDLTIEDFIWYYNEARFLDDAKINTFTYTYDKKIKPKCARARYEKAQHMLNEYIKKYLLTYEDAYHLLAKQISKRYVIDGYEFTAVHMAHSYREYKKIDINLFNGTKDSGKNCIFDLEKHKYPPIHPTKSYHEVFGN